MQSQLALIQFRPTPSDLPRLKQPFGRLITGEPDKTMPELKKLVRSESPIRVTAVGDVVSRETIVADVPVDLRIIDHISMRKPSASFRFEARKTYHVKNPPGVIAEESWDLIKQAMVERDVMILVDGEEDLLTLPCIAESPDHSFVLYGQPSEGLVVVDTTHGIKKEASDILGRMSKERVG